MKEIKFSLIFLIFAHAMNCLNYVTLPREVKGINYDSRDLKDLTELRDTKEKMKNKEIKMSCLILIKTYLTNNRTSEYIKDIIRKNSEDKNLIFDNIVNLMMNNCMKSEAMNSSSDITNKIISDENKYFDSNFDLILGEILNIPRIKEEITKDGIKNKVERGYEKLEDLKDIEIKPEIITNGRNGGLYSIMFNFFVGCLVGLSILLPIYIYKTQVINKQTGKSKKKRN